MKKKNLSLLEDFFLEHLATINDAKFTKREIDVIACILHGRTAKGSATLLSILPRTVQVHTQNIRNKLGVSSQEGIINFIESSEKLLLVRDYYSKLLIEFTFEKKLEEISKLELKGNPKSLIIYGARVKDKRTFFKKVEENLEKAGLKASVCEYRADQTSDEKRVSSQTSILVAREEMKSNFSDTFPNRECIDFSTCQSYYAVVFKILKRLYPSSEIEKINSTFKEEDNKSKVSSPSRVDQSPPEPPPFFPEERRSKNSKALLWRLSVALCCLVIGILFVTFFQTGKEIDQIRSDLLIPVESALLHRPQILKQIDQKLKEQTGIQIVALIGIGGAGKTTLARQYMRQQNSPIIWEMNAETRESLSQSFEDLAFYLSTTNKDKSLLQEIKEIKDPNEREKKIVFFTAKKLSALPNWLMLYDNVEHFQRIQYFFPYNELQWGKGKVIITTRDNNISNSNYINPAHVIHIQDLTAEEKYILFTCILYGEKTKKLTNFQKNEVKVFLKNLPSFPLDISTAAYYLKDVKISFQEYMERTQGLRLSDDFKKAQEVLLNEISNYTKTRYGIITLAIEKLLNEHPDFRELILAISFLDSQNIPIELLKTYKKNTIVEKFVRSLRKNSFITAEVSIAGVETFSLHRSIQEIIFAYLVKFLSLEKERNILLPFLESMDSYVCEVIWKENIDKMKLLMSHLNSFFKYKDVLPSIAKAYINGNLGSIFNYLGDYDKAEKYHKESLLYFKQHTKKYPLKVAWAMEQLGEVYSELGKYQSAIELYESSLLLYKRDSLKNQAHIARATSNVGYVYKEVGEYKHSKKLLEQSLNLYKKYDPKNYVGIAWTLLYFGYLYQDIGDYQEAKNYYERSLAICKKNLPKDHMLSGWVLSHLGNMYEELGNREKAGSLINQALSVCRLHFSENHVGFAVLLSHLGNHYAALKNYAKAKEYYKKSYLIYRNHYSEDHVRIARIMRDLGKISLLEGKYEEGSDFLKSALCLFEKNKHPEIYSVFEELAELFFKKFLIEQTKGNITQAQTLKEQSIHYLSQALEALNLRFPKDSPHIARIGRKLKNIKTE